MRRPRAPWVVELAEEDLVLLGAPSVSAQPAKDALADRRAAPRRPRPDARSAEGHPVPEMPGVARPLPDGEERRHLAHGHHAFDAAGMQDAEQHGDPAAPVVPSHAKALDVHRVEQPDDVAHERLLAVAAGRRLRPAEPAQIRTDDAVVLREPRDDAMPDVPVLRIAVEKD